MCALAASGNQAGALVAFDSYRGRLARETGLRPLPVAAVRSLFSDPVLPLAFAGRASEAAESAQEALAIATHMRHAEWTAASLRGLGIAWEAAGKPDQAEDAFRRSLRAAEGNRCSPGGPQPG